MRFKAGIIGLGRIGSTLESDDNRMHPCTHMGAMVHFNRSIEVIAACDISSKKRKVFKKQWAFKSKIYSDYKKMITDQEIDILCISSSTESHHEICKYAIKNNIQGIILEKPVAKSLKSAYELKKLSTKYNVPIIIAHDRRFYNRYINAKKLMSKSNLGPILSITGKLYSYIPKKISSDHNPILHDGTHIMDIATYFAGTPISLKFSSINNKKNGYPINIYGNVRFKKNIIFNMELDSRTDYYDLQLLISGKRGQIYISTNRFEVFGVNNNTDNIKFLRRLDHTQNNPNNPYKKRVKTMIDFLKGKRKSLISDIHNGVLAELLCEKAWESVINKNEIYIDQELIYFKSP